MIIACDTEATGLSVWHGDRPFAISLCFENEETGYVDFPVDPKTREVKVTESADLVLFKSYLEDEKIDKVFHHAKYDMRMLESIDIHVKGKIHDTSIMARCTNTLEENVRLKFLSKKYLNIDTKDEEELKTSVNFYRRKAKGLHFRIGEVNAEDYWLPKLFNPSNNLCEIYCKLDSLRCMRLCKYYMEAMKEFGVMHTYEKELQLLLVLYEMEGKGLYTNLSRIEEGIKYCKFKSEETEQKLFSKYGSINLDSPKQLGPYLVGKLGLPIAERTEGGKTAPMIATGLPVLRRYTQYNDDLTLLFKRGAYETIRGYYENYHSHYVHNYIHCTIKQFDTRTFRLSVVDPNMQNVANPITSGGNISYVREEQLVNARRCFGPRPETKWLVIDYKQLELRIFASRAEEETLITVFLTGGDPHDTTRCKCPYLFAMPKEQGRKIAKNTNFTVINVGGKQALYDKYNIPLEQGAIVVKEFKEAYPRTKIRGYECERFAKKHGYIINAYNDKIFVEYGLEYQATSYDIQSSAARQIKRAMLRLFAFFKRRNLRTCLLLQVHDELVIEVPEEEFDEQLVIEVKNIMEDHGGAYSIPTPVEVSIVKESWDKKVEYKFNGC